MNKIVVFFKSKGTAIAFGIITAIFTIVPEDCFKVFNWNCNWPDEKNIIINRIIVCSFILVLANLCFNIYSKRRKTVSISGVNYSVKVEYGDLLKISGGKVIINFDECFSTIVGEKPSDIKAGSVCGQYLRKYPSTNIKALIKKAGVNPSDNKSQYRDLDCYTSGTLIPNGKYLLMSFAKLDKNGLGNLTYNEYLSCLNTLWEQIDLYHGTSDVYMPVLGASITRFDKELTQQELLDIIISSYRLSPKKMKKPYTLHIVCRQREDFSLNDIFGIDY